MYLGVEELKEIIENLKSQLSSPSPFASTEAFIEGFGLFVEEKCGLRGYGKRLKANVDLVSAVDSILPLDLGDYAAPVQIVGNLAKEAWLTYKENRDGTSTNQTPFENHGGGTIPSGEDNGGSEHDKKSTKRTSESIDSGMWRLSNSSHSNQWEYSR